MSACRSLEYDPERPSAFIQWKGTQACIDFYCACGAQLHADEMFLYAVQCPHCLQRYELPSNMALLPIDEPCEWHEPKLLAPDRDLPAPATGSPA